jgi:hypothetical protein
VIEKNVGGDGGESWIVVVKDDGFLDTKNGIFLLVTLIITWKNSITMTSLNKHHLTWSFTLLTVPV